MVILVICSLINGNIDNLFSDMKFTAFYTYHFIEQYTIYTLVLCGCKKKSLWENEKMYILYFHIDWVFT
jgi:hypothetical protein